MEREEILREIRRTAEANGGRPLGRRMFERETGVRESDWSGRLWARWGDAVKEAGFLPNRMTVAFPREELAQTYLRVTRKLGRLPTVAELQLEKRRDPTFPSSQTFERLGRSRAARIAEVRALCVLHPGWDGAREFSALVPAAPPTSRARVRQAAAAELGAVYLDALRPVLQDRSLQRDGPTAV